MQPIKTALVGYGLGGRCFHAPFIANLPQYYDLRMIFERSKDTAKERYPSVQIVRSIEAILENPEIELVVVTTPNDTHYPYALAALEAGKNVVVDKPMTITAQQAHHLIQVAKEKNLVCSVYQNRRYASDARTLQKVIKSGALGDVWYFEAQYHRFRPELKNSWKETSVPGSGILYDLGAHLIDQALHLFGIPQTLVAHTEMQRPGTEAIDYFDIILQFASTRVRLTAGMLVREQGPRLQLHGTKGSFIKNGDDPQDMAAREGILPSDPNWGLEDPSIFGLLHNDEGKQIIPSEKGDFGLYYENFYKHVREGAVLREKPEHGYNVVTLIEQALLSSEQQQVMPVSHLLLPVEYII